MNKLLFIVLAMVSLLVVNAYAEYVYFRKDVLLTTYGRAEDIKVKAGECLQVNGQEVLKDGQSMGFLPTDSIVSTYNSKTRLSTNPSAVIAVSCQEAIDKSKTMDAEDKNELEKRQRQLAKEKREKQQRDAKIKSFPPDIQRCISEKKVQIGMSTEQVILSWGRPEHINRSVGKWGEHEQWVYGSTYLYFENGIMTSFQDSRR